jgi:glycopeptide antibiotics resistance protein
MTFHDGYLTLIPGYWVILPAIPVAVWVLRRGADRRWTLMALLAVVHVTAVVGLTIFPIPIAGQDFYRQTRGLSEDNVIPFATILGQLVSSIPSPHHSLISSLHQLLELVGNMIALAPLAIYGPALWPSLRSWRRFALLAVAFSAGIELTQLAGSLMEGFTYRVTDIDDVIVNASGAVAAFFIWRSMERRGLVDRWFGRWLDPKRSPGAPAATPPPARIPG